MKRAVPFLAIAALWSATTIETRQAPQPQSGATITFTAVIRADPNLIDRDWGARLRNFKSPVSGSEIYIGSGDLSFAGNRKVADTTWIDPPGPNTFTLTYAPSPARITMTAGDRRLPASSMTFKLRSPIRTSPSTTC